MGRRGVPFLSTALESMLSRNHCPHPFISVKLTMCLVKDKFKKLLLDEEKQGRGREIWQNYRNRSIL